MIYTPRVGRHEAPGLDWMYALLVTVPLLLQVVAFAVAFMVVVMVLARVPWPLP